ncbi:MAG TPA: TIGR03790 family protein, partial [Luteolibacter sp.]|nr:TIGR03790 family protein [Luteolibacter sp.]
MKAALLCFCISGAALAATKGINPESVAVVYNSAVAESKKLAELYAAERGVPAGNLVGLELPVTSDISRADYIAKIQNPLRQEFDRHGWWSRAKDPVGVLLPTSNDIRVMVLMRGVPLRIQPAPLPENAKIPAGDPIAGRNEASVDSELAMFGVEGVPAEGVLKNVYFQSDKPFSEVRFPFLILTARIDAASVATCERMIKEPKEAEKTGLWGRAYVDIANKYPQGDQWLSAIVTANRNTGIPTVVDRFSDTLPMNYPMTDASLYYGWYDWNISGPFLNPSFHFRKGAVAMHLHSFSAEQLSNPAANWSAGLLEKGAAVTIGNVYEPYLGLTHFFDILHNRLLAGHSWVEACWMAIPVASWQGIVLGDPLYRPFLHLDGSGDIVPEDNDYRALRAAVEKWPTDAE